MLRYRLRTATVGVHQEIGCTHSVVIIIPSGTVVKVFDGSATASGFVDVDWDGERVQLFAVDLADRGEIMKAREQSA